MTICVDVLGASVLTEEEEHSYIWGRQENIMRIDFNSRCQYGFMTFKNMYMYLLYACICGHVYMYMCTYIFVYIFKYVCM